jgi:hypothetical protein
MPTVTRTATLRTALVVLAIATTACGELKATTIQLGRSLNSDKSVGNHTTSFAPEDTIYAVVLTDGIASGLVSARWSYGGRVISEPQRQVRYKGPAATEFHIQNSGGFPPGEYEVELFVDGTSAGVRKFRVDRPAP